MASLLPQAPCKLRLPPFLQDAISPSRFRYRQTQRAGPPWSGSHLAPSLALTGTQSSPRDAGNWAELVHAGAQQGPAIMTGC